MQYAANHSRYFSLIGLADDDRDSWRGVDSKGNLIGNWSSVPRGEIRRVLGKTQEEIFGRVVVPYNPSTDDFPDDDTLVSVDKSAPAAAELPASLGVQIDNPVEREIMRKIQIDVLGKLRSGGVKVFSSFHKRTDVIKDPGRMTYEQLLLIAGPPAKDYVVKSAMEDVPGTYSFMQVKEAIAILGGYTNIGEQTELGVGVWEGIEPPDSPSSVVLVGAGEACYLNGTSKLVKVSHPRAKGHLLDFETGELPWYNYDVLSSYLDNYTPEFAKATKNECIILLNKWRWKHQVIHPIVGTGLIFATWVQAFWHWRPQVAITGASKAGKSTLWNALEGMYGNLCIKASKPSAAGVRQAIGRTSKVVIIDEFEAEKHRAEILEMLRASSRGDKILRGSPDQRGHEFRLRHITWVAAIEVGLKREPDRNRFITMELVRPPEQDRGKLVLPPPSYLLDLGTRMLAVAIKSVGRAKELAVLLKDTRVAGVDDRIVESYAVPAAMLASIDGMSDTEAREILTEMLHGVDREESGGISDDYLLMADILGAHIFTGRDRLSAGQLIEAVLTNNSKYGSIESCETALGKSGLKIDEFGSSEAVPMHLRGKRCLVVAYRMVLSHLLKDTDWAGQSIQQILRRIPGTMLSRRRVGGQNAHCLLIPESYLDQELLGRSAQETAHQEASAAEFV